MLHAMERKSLAVDFKADGAPGEFRAIFSSFNVVDKDGDVTIPGAFTKGQEVRIAQWGHNWDALPVGKGIIDADAEKAWVDGAFFLDTTHGLDSYKTVKNLGGLQEWSFGFAVKSRRDGKFAGQDVRFLDALDVFEVSPVMLGAGIDTRTEFVKAATIAEVLKSAGSFGEQCAVLAEAINEQKTYAEHYADMRSEKGRSLSAGARESLKQLTEAVAGAGPVFAAVLRDNEPPKAALVDLRIQELIHERNIARLNGVA